jgi:hypothetical protein
MGMGTLGAVGTRAGQWWRRRWRRVLLGVGAVVLALAMVPESLVHPFVERAVDRHGGDCVELDGFEVLDAGSWPVVARAATGRMRGIATHADEVLFDQDFPIHDVWFTADEIDVAPLRFGMDGGDAVVKGGRSRATVAFADLEEIAADLGIDMTLRWDGAQLVSDVQVPVLGVLPTTVDLQGVDGDLEMRYAALDVFELPPFVLELPDPVTYDGYSPQADGIEITTTIDGTVTADTWACDAGAGTEAAVS